MPFDSFTSIPSTIHRRQFLKKTTATALAGFAGLSLPFHHANATESRTKRMVQTVLGPVLPEKLGVTLMHEHAPVVDWSELYETPAAPVRDDMLVRTAKLLDDFHKTLSSTEGPGAIVEATPIRVGRDPRLLVKLAKQTKVHIIAASGFWCEALAPQHPWAVRMSVSKSGLKKMTDLFIREVTQGMEDPTGQWGEKYTNIRAGIIKIGTSTYLRPSERACHIAAAIASKETGCPITTHTTSGGGLEEAQLLLKNGAAPEKIIIGHQGHQDDRKNDEANEYHRLITQLGCNVQFDRVGHAEYPCDSQARQIKELVDAGFVKQILVSHDHAPYYYPEFTTPRKSKTGWKQLESDYTIVTTQLVDELTKLNVAKTDIHTIYVENPKRVLAF